MSKSLPASILLAGILCSTGVADPAGDRGPSQNPVQIKGRIVDKNGKEVNLKKWSPYATHNLCLVVPDSKAISFQLNNDGTFLTGKTTARVFYVEGIFYMDDARDVELYGDQIRIPPEVPGTIFDMGDIRIDYPPNPVPEKSPPPGSATVRVLDAATGEAIKDAVVTPFGLCIPNGSLGWFKDGRDAVLPEEQRTGSDGEASIAYPLAISRDHLFGEIAPDRNLSVVGLRIHVRHKKYLSVSRDFHRVDGGADPIRLEKGTKLTVRAKLSEDGPVLKERVHAQVGFGWYLPDEWEWKNDGLFHGVLPHGEQLFRVAHRSKKGKLYFSRAEHIILQNNGQATRELVLEPATIVRGSLDPAVPRPVKNGWIAFHSTRKSQNQFFGSLDWNTHVPVKEDGSFEVQLPVSDLTKYAARCDGWVSKNISKEAAPITKTQRFNQMPGKDLPVEMQPSSHARIRLTDLFGNGIPDATVTFFPARHMSGFPGGKFAPLQTTGNFPDDTANANDGLDRPVENWVSKTDRRGVVEFRDIPSSGREYFKIEHPRFRAIENAGKFQKIVLKSCEWIEQEIQMELDPLSSGE